MPWPANPEEVTMLFSDTSEQRIFADVLAESAPRGLLDAVV
jgi:hypothetical protein